MSATNHTENYNLPIFVEQDIPTWLGDWNTTMKTIDTSLHDIKESSKSDVNKAYVDEQISKINTSISALEATLNNLVEKAVTWDETHTGITAKQYEQLKIKANV